MRSEQTTEPSEAQPIIGFSNAGAFRRWLAKHHGTHPGIWMKIAKMGSGIASITYPEALDEALCFGWIDGQRKAFDAAAFLQKFTRRAPRSQWSKINSGHVERLTREGRIQPAGLAAVAAARADGRWERAYHASRAVEVPEDFLAAIASHPTAMAFFEALNQSNRGAIIHHLITAKKPETRARRLKQFVGMLKRGEKLY